MTALYNKLLTDLARHLGLDEAEGLIQTQELALDDFRVGFNYAPLDVNEPTIGDIEFFTLLGRPDAAREAAVHRLMLEGNNLWAGTGGATLGVQRESGAAVLAMSLPVETTTAQALAEALGAFAEVAVFWRAVVSGQADAQSPAANGTFNVLDQRA